MSPKMRNRINRKSRRAQELPPGWQGQVDGNGNGNGNYGRFNPDRRYVLEAPSFLVAD
eukprot:CAMPEP_0185728036 /NCGR_PEP_ID=MMETSP1171-20130828/3536_1 /TAXON_ID=374046 /ORGANISM="Helicotheca tamensis, Strain CCMP826" /LENGTH=57 /DNA_ID=CAMNT_0028396699 /DNA_START=98 /DNA_END=271 /DNA_ORIENTATION=+